MSTGNVTQIPTPEQVSYYWKRITPRPRTRNLVVGSVGSGKSTLGASILERYHSYYPSHDIFLIDPKHRFVASEYEGSKIFPQGTTATNHGRIEGVSVNGRMLRSVNAVSLRHRGVYVIQDIGVALELYDWLFRKSDVRKPVMIYNDESMDLHRNGLVDYRFKRIIQMGREKGLGHITINQRPKRIDVTLISESERIYVGTLHNINDRRALAETVAVRNSRELLEPMPYHVFWMIDQVKPEMSMKLRIAA